MMNQMEVVIVYLNNCMFDHNSYEIYKLFDFWVILHAFFVVC